MINLFKDQSNIGSGSVIGQINFRGPNHWGGLIVARSVGSWGSNSNQAGTQLEFWTQDNTINSNLGVKMVLNHNGNVGIGTTNPGSWRLAVNGAIRAKEIKVETDWSDFVFEDDYELPTLQEVENHIKENGHLKDIPNAEEVEKNGVFLGKMNSKLLQKIEELTLYTIQQEKKIKKLEKKNEELIQLSNKFLELQSRLEKLESEE